MEAWIVHIRTETVRENGQTLVGNRYTAWMNEKQALKAVGKYLIEGTEYSWSGPFVDNRALRIAVRSLVKSDNIQEAIDLANDYSEAGPYKSGGGQSSKIQIAITQSTFLGSPFE